MQDIDFDRGTWAVVTAVGGKKYIGSFDLTTQDDILGCAAKGQVLLLENAFEFSNAMMPMRGPGGEQGMQRLSQCSPPNNCISPDKIWVIVGDVQFFSEMEPENLSRHKSLVEQSMTQSMSARAQSAGLVIPHPHVPNPSGLPT